MKKLAIGLMTGTSLDGIDTVLIEVEGYGKKTRYKELLFRTYEIHKDTTEKIKLACNPEKSNVRLICSLNFYLTELYSQAIYNIVKEAGLRVEDIDFVGSHGQTVWHEPFGQGEYFPSTLQLGPPSYISQKTGITTVANFRVADMAQGGQGAPLVPYIDYILFSSKDKGRILQNIGGIGNLTYLAKDGDINEVIGFDTGPGNMIIDEICKIHKNSDYDKNGEFAARGTVKKEILEYLMNHSYIKEDLPKSTGREEFGQLFTREFLARYIDYDIDDLIATVTMFTAKSIVYHYEKYIFPLGQVDEVIISGGGAYNLTLMNHLKNLLKNCKVYSAEEFGIKADSKEAIAFALLANETLNSSCSNLPSGTGAKKYAILGEIGLGNRYKLVEKE